MTHVVVIGASLSGSVAAISLAQQGVRVSLIDKAPFPRRKPCGEGLSARGLGELERIGIDITRYPDLAWGLKGYRINSGSSWSTISDRSGLVGIRRSELDAELISYASKLPLITIHQAITLDSIESDAEKFVITFGRHAITTPYVVIADGASSPTLRALGKKLAVPASPRLGASSSWQITRGTLEPYVHTSFISGGEMYLTPLSRGGVNISVLGSKTLIQRAVHPALLREIVKSVATQLNIEIEMTAPPLGSGSLNSRCHGGHFRGAFVVGDACETFDPCAGFGMTHATLSGRLAAEHILKAQSNSSRDGALQDYSAAREHIARPIRGFTRLTSTMMSSRLGRIGFPIAAKTGVAGMVSHAVHSTTNGEPLRSLLSLVGGLRERAYAEGVTL
jgi:flavin-dependent dehydrogenase